MIRRASTVSRSEKTYSGAALLDPPNRRRKVKRIAKLCGQANRQLWRSTIDQVRLGYVGVDVILKTSAAAGEHQ